MGWLASVPAYFALRIASALVLLKLSASWLSVAEFASFAQFMLFAALVNMLSVGGIQNGLIREAAAAPDKRALLRVERSAFTIWLAGLGLLGPAVILFSPFVSDLLVGSSGQWRAVILIGGLGLAAGPAQIWSSLLSGRKRVTSSLSAQATGLVAGTTLAAFMLARGRPEAAVAGFAAGGLVTALSACLVWRAARPKGIVARGEIGEVRLLLRYSAALAATTGFTAATLFGLRSLYRDAFGAHALGYWMAANRISDMSTQLLGLVMVQFFVPHFTTAASEAARRTLQLRCWLGGLIVMGAALALFSLMPERLVRLFLSDSYLAAIPAIRLYMTGDFFRVWASLAMFSAFARGQPGRYAAIEIGAMSLMAAITAGLIEAGRSDAPLLGYAGAYFTMAVLVSLAWLVRFRAAGRDYLGDRVAHVEQLVETA